MAVKVRGKRRSSALSTSKAAVVAALAVAAAAVAAPARVASLSVAAGYGLPPRAGPTTAAADPLSSAAAAGHRATVSGSVAKEERRARDRTFGRSPRELCGRCSRPPSLCVCGALPAGGPVRTRTRVLILQHPNERRKRHVSTVPLLQLVLEKAEVKFGYRFGADELEAVRNEIEAGRAPLLLYPGPDAISLDVQSEEGSVLTTGPTLSVHENVVWGDEGRLLILFDGTWTEAKRMARDSPSLVEACQKVQFASDATNDCVYGEMRPEPDAHCLSTLEACARALELLEPQGGGDGTAREALDALDAVLRVHVDSHLKNMESNIPRFNVASLDSTEDKKRRRLEIERKMYGEDALLDDSGNYRALATLDDGAVIRTLSLVDAPTVDAWWEYRSPKSLAQMRRRIALDGGVACLGVVEPENDGEGDGPILLRACILRYEGGALGMLHVDEPYRRRGYGAALLNEASRALADRGEERVAYIVDGNAASEAVFRSCGWERADPGQKKGTGRRRSKKLWVQR